MIVPGIGDAVEIRVMRIVKDREPFEAWLPATVTLVDTQALYVAFSDGDRLAVPLGLRRGVRQWRRP